MHDIEKCLLSLLTCFKHAKIQNKMPDKVYTTESARSFLGSLIIIDYLPFDSNTCDVSLMAKGNSLGTTGSKAFCAKFPESIENV